MEFKVGNIVRCIDNSNLSNQKIKSGDTGKILEINDSSICIEFNKYVSGHTCDSGINGKSGHCWCIRKKYLEIVEQYKIEGDYEILDEIESVTSLRIYTIKRNIKTGKISCNCPSWIYKNGIKEGDSIENYKSDRMCKHIKQWMEKTGQEIKINYRKEDKEYDNILTDLENLEKYV